MASPDEQRRQVRTRSVKGIIKRQPCGNCGSKLRGERRGNIVYAVCDACGQDNRWERLR